MSSEQLFKLLQNWVKKLWFDELNISYHPQILDNAIATFYHDYLRWFPEDKKINIEKLLLTPQLIAVLCYRISRCYHIEEIDNRGGYYIYNRQIDWPNRNLLFSRNW